MQSTSCALALNNYAVSIDSRSNLSLSPSLSHTHFSIHLSLKVKRNKMMLDFVCEAEKSLKLFIFMVDKVVFCKNLSRIQI